MLRMKDKEKIIIGILIILIIIISGTIYIRMGEGTEIVLSNSVEPEITPTIEPTPTETQIKNITSYICGYVQNPGNVTVPEGTRLEYALKLVGGATEEADLNVVNLAHKLSDEEMIYIPKVGEELDDKTSYIPGSNNVVSKKPGKVNINTASISELDTLPGVGPSTAQKIIDYRSKNGSFQSIEEITNVTGIGEKKFDTLKDFVIVD